MKCDAMLERTLRYRNILVAAHGHKGRKRSDRVIRELTPKVITDVRFKREGDDLSVVVLAPGELFTILWTRREDPRAGAWELTQQLEEGGLLTLSQQGDERVQWTLQKS